MRSSYIVNVNESNPNPLASAWADHSRSWQSNVYAYPVLSRRAGGISLGVNLNLDKACSFACPYCQVDRTVPGSRLPIDVDAISAELEALIAEYRENGLALFSSFQDIPAEKRVLRDLCLSGDGESTMAPAFAEVCQRLLALQKVHADLDFKLILITNATLLHRAPVQQGLQALCAQHGEIWGKLDAGSEAWFQRVNVSRYTLDHIERNLSTTARAYPLRIQTMLCSLQGEMPSPAELEAYAVRVARIRAAAPEHFLSVQLYSVVRSTALPLVGPVPLTFLENTAQLLRRASPGIAVGIFP